MKKFIIPSIVTLATVAPALACFFVIKKRGEKVFRIRDAQENGINIEEVAEFEAKSYNHSIFVFDDIYNAYYKKIYGRR